MPMSFQEGTLSEHLMGSSVHYRVPVYQRNYSWKKDNWETIWIDIMRQYQLAAVDWNEADRMPRNIASLEKLPKHFIGAFLTAESVAVIPAQSAIVDGQQRLLTSVAIMMAIRDCQLKQPDKSQSSESETIIARFDSYVSNTNFPTIRNKIAPQETDLSSYSFLINPERQPGKIKAANTPIGAGSTTLIDAFNYFYAEMRRETPSNKFPELAAISDLYPLNPEILEWTVLNRLYAAKIVASDGDDANAIFGSLNAKGLGLRQVDLIKNLLFIQLGSAAVEVHQNLWFPMESLLTPDQLDEYVWAWQVLSGDPISRKRTYESVNRTFAGASQETVKDYVRYLWYFSGQYLQLDDPSEIDDPILSDSLVRVRRAGGKTALPLLLFLLMRVHSDSATVDDFASSVSLIESYLVRRLIAEKPTQTLNSIFGGLAAKAELETRKPDWDGTLYSLVLSLLATKAEDWPTDYEVMVGVSMGAFYQAQKPENRIHVLRCLDESLQEPGQVAVDYVLSDKCIEHIAPQNKDAVGWKSGSNWLEVWNRRHSLANLTLLPSDVNSSLGDSSWVHKKGSYLTSGYALTTQVAKMNPDGDSWGVEELDERAKTLGRLIATLWPRPIADSPA